MKKVFSSPESARIGLLKSLLENAGIPCFIKENLSGIYPGVTAFPAELMIANDDDYEKAMMLIDSWKKEAPQPGENWTCLNCGEVLEGQFHICWKCGTPRESTT
jgi:hypothetical protein